MNDALLFGSTALECALVGLLVARKLSRSLPAFTLLLLFYVVRSVCLFTLFSLMARPKYREMASLFSDTDIVLQLAVSVEFFRLTLQQTEQAIRAKLWVLVLSYLLGGIAAVGLARTLPARSPVPVDRATILLGVSFLVLLIYAGRSGLRKPAIFLLGGLAAVDLSSSLSQVGRSIAALHRDLPAFVRWSYASAAVYLLVLFLWCALLLLGPASWGSLKRTSPGAEASQSPPAIRTLHSRGV